MPLSSSVLLLTIFLNIILGIVVYFKTQKNPSILFFFFIIISVFFWATPLFIYNFTDSPLVALSLGKISYFAAGLSTLSFLGFSIFFNSDKISSLKRNLLLIFYIVAIVFLIIITFNNFLLVGFSSFSGGSRIIKFGYLYPLYTFFISTLFIISFTILYKKYKNETDGLKKRQLEYIFIGFLITVIGGIITNLILPTFKYFELYWLGPIFTLGLIIFITLAIIKHHLFNIKIIATELLTFSIWIFILIQTLLADSLRNQLTNGTLLLLVIVFGIFLIKSVIREVEQREKLEVLTKELNATNERLVKLDKLKSEFLSFASHQVKTPITIVKGYASLIADGTYGQVSDKIKEIALRIVSASDRMVGLVNSILDSRKIEDGRMEYKFGEVEIVELVNNVVVDLKSVAERKGLIFNIELPNEKLIVKADENKFRQVVQNILDNAIKYTDQGWVEVELEKKNDSLLLSVSDSGRGISKELLPRIFDQWTRDSKVVREIQGTGLGLYIAKEIVIAHGGEIWAESRGVGEGSTFYVRLKLLR